MDLFLVTLITCKQAVGLLSKIQNNLNIEEKVKKEIIYEIMSEIKSCPVIIKDANKKP